MRKMFSLILALALATNLSAPAFAVENTTDNISSIELPSGHVVFTSAGDPDARVYFVDPALMKDNGIQPLGEQHEVYDHSYYVYSHKTMTADNVGPRENDRFLISVARGATKKLTSTVSVSGTVGIEVNVGIDIEEVIKIGVTGNASGTKTFTWGRETTYSGPDAPYNSRSYYAAINYDIYTCYVTRYDVYTIYNGSSPTLNTVEYKVGLIAVEDVKVPRPAEYSIDSIQ